MEKEKLRFEMNGIPALSNSGLPTEEFRNWLRRWKEGEDPAIELANQDNIQINFQTSQFQKDKIVSFANKYGLTNTDLYKCALALLIYQMNMLEFYSTKQISAPLERLTFTNIMTQRLQLFSPEVSFGDELIDKLGSVKTSIDLLKRSVQNTIDRELAENLTERFSGITDQVQNLINHVNMTLRDRDIQEDLDIIFADDNIEFHRQFSDFIQMVHNSLNVEYFSSPLKVLHFLMICAKRPKVLFLDLKFEGMDLQGMELFKKISKIAYLRDIKIFFLTAMSEDEVTKDLEKLDEEMQPDGIMYKESGNLINQFDEIIDKYIKRGRDYMDGDDGNIQDGITKLS